MKTKIFTLFLVLASAVSMHAAITYELNGGVTNDYGWMSKSDMFTACITDALGYDLGISLDEFKRSNTPFDDLFVFFNVTHCQNILDTTKWDWLEDYIIAVQEEEQLAAKLTQGSASKDWRYAIAAFFFDSQYDTSADYSEAGKDEAYIPYWKHGYDNPANPTKDFTLNAPYKEGFTFVGWYTTSNFSGAKVTAVNASTTGTLYAKWDVEYMMVKDTITNLVIDTETMTIYGGPSTTYDIEVLLAIDQDNGDGTFTLSKESAIEILRQEAIFIDGYVYDLDVNAPAAKAVLHVDFNGELYELQLTMSAAPHTPHIVIEIADAIVAIDTIVLSGNTYEYALEMRADWTFMDDGVTYPVLVEVPVYYPDVKEPFEILSTVTIGGMGDNDPWLAFGEGTLTIFASNGSVTAQGTVYNSFINFIADITISGKLPTPEISCEDIYTEEYISACDSYAWNGKTYTTSGDYTYTTTAANGCDSIVTLHLTINKAKHKEVNHTACDSYSWNGQTYTQSGDYTYTITAANGCDSIVTLHLTINKAKHKEVNHTACDSYTWNGQTYTQSGDYTYTTTAANGCDSIVTLHLTINKAKHKEVNHTACDSYTWNGQTYTQSGDYTYTITAANGCDSIVTLHLTINHSEIGKTESATICYGETYTWNSQTYSAAGEYSVTLSNINGCDSVATLHLSVMPKAQEEIQYETINKTQTPFVWNKNGKRYYETTLDSIFMPYTHYDCDSMIHILNLTVVDVEDVKSEYDTICESALPYEWHGQSITAGGRYEYTEKYGETNINILNVLYLTITPTIRTQQFVTICYGETFDWNGKTLAQSGNYTYTTEAANGCDSIITLHLTVLPQAITIHIDTMIAHADLPFIWRGQYCPSSGEYTDAVPFAANSACDSVIYILNLTVEAANKCGANLSWGYSNGTLTITGSGAMYDNPEQLSYRAESWYPSRVRQVILSNEITHIGNVAFADCANLTHIDIPSSVTSIGDGAFSWTGLQSITIPASVTELGEQVFEACNNLHTIIYEGNPIAINNQTVHPLIGCVHLDTVIAPAALWHCTNADKALEKRYGVPHKARYIEVTDGFLTNQAIKYIAQNATALEVLDLTNATNTTLPYGALSNSYLLSTLYFPQYIENIPESMIEGGRNLSEIVIPATVTEIGNYAFAGCINVWRMTVEATTPPTVYENTFDGVSRSISVLVPAGSEQAYREAEYWREFFIDNTNSPLPISNCQKILREDQILILREGKVYTTMGQLITIDK